MSVSGAICAGLWNGIEYDIRQISFGGKSSTVHRRLPALQAKEISSFR
jgi:hypothetical protein